MTISYNLSKFISNIDLFQVDTVFIKRQRRKTKNTLGGLLTILVPIICTAVFLFLYYNNELKEDIINTEIISTTTLNEPLKFRLEWNTDLINTSSIYPIELVTSTGKQTLCYQSKMKQSSSSSLEEDKNEVKLCNYDTDLLGEPNGVGFMFETIVQKDIKPILPVKQNDFILYHEKNLVAYVVSAEKNNFCIYDIKEFKSVCYPFKFIAESNHIIISDQIFYINGDLYLSFYDNINKLYLFKNHILLKVEKTNCNFFVNENTKYCLSHYNDTSKFISFQNENNISSLIYKFTKLDKLTTYFNPNYFVFNKFIKQDLTINLNYYNYNSTELFSKNYKIVNGTIYKIIDQNNTLNFYYKIECPEDIFLSNLIYLSRKLYNNTQMDTFSIEKIEPNQYSFYTCVLLYNYDTHIFSSKSIINSYNFTNNFEIYRLKYLGSRYINTISFFDVRYLDKSKTNYEILNFMIIDIDLNLSYINKSQSELKWIADNLWGTNKTPQNTFIFSLLSSNYPINNNWNNVINIGNFLECSNEGNCTSLYTSSLNIYLINNSSSLFTEDKWIVKLKILNSKNNNNNNNVLTLNYSNILTSLSMQNEYRIQSYNIINNNDNYDFSLVKYKRLYSININNDPLVNSSDISFSNYYIYDNTLLGHDKKFSCIPNPTTNNNDFNSLKIFKNKVNCPIYNFINFPFISDIGYQITDSNLITTRYDTNKQIGMFILNLDPFFLKTTTTSTKASIYTIIGNTLSVYSVLLTLFLFLKNKIYNFENQVELNRRNTVDENNVDLEHGSIVYTDNQIYSSSKIDDIKINDIKVDDNLNIQLSTMRHSSEYIEKLSTV